MEFWMPRETQGFRVSFSSFLVSFLNGACLSNTVLIASKAILKDVFGSSLFVGAIDSV